ncbi:MAG: hypothetical protein M3494_12630 [Actinomycetota bacterium]|nr:hypothetical protein [Actinomycetota bacterium]
MRVNVRHVLRQLGTGGLLHGGEGASDGSEGFLLALFVNDDEFPGGIPCAGGILVNRILGGLGSHRGREHEQS